MFGINSTFATVTRAAGNTPVTIPAAVQKVIHAHSNSEEGFISLILKMRKLKPREGWSAQVHPGPKRHNRSLSSGFLTAETVQRPFCHSTASSSQCLRMKCCAVSALFSFSFLKLLQGSISSVSESDVSGFSVLTIRATPPEAGLAANYVCVTLTSSRLHTQIGNEAHSDTSFWGLQAPPSFPPTQANQRQSPFV